MRFLTRIGDALEEKGRRFLESVVPPVLAHGDINTPTERIPDFVDHPTLTCIRDGVWNNPDTWDGARVPVSSDKVAIPKDRFVVPTGLCVAESVGVRPGGKIAFEHNMNSYFRVGTLLLEEGGSLEVGTENLPITTNCEILVGGYPLDLERDPSQYGQGLILLGKVRMHGRKIERTKVFLNRQPRMGDRRLYLKDPVDWQPGSILIIPDTRQLAPDERLGAYVSQVEEVEIDDVSEDGKIIYLVQALAHDHLGARDCDNNLVCINDIGIITRNIVVRSADPSGVRGHILMHRFADIDIRYVHFDELGRTTVEPLDSTTRDDQGNVKHIGTNQIGRYAIHLHRLIGPQEGRGQGINHQQYYFIGNSVTRSRKWAVAIHDSHFGVLHHNVIYKCAGGGIVTEEGGESYNQIDDNFINSVTGSGKKPLDRGELKTLVDMAHEGTGIWLRGPMNAVRRNSISNCEYCHYSMFTGLFGVRLPKWPGADTRNPDQYIERGNIWEGYDWREPKLPQEGNVMYGATRIGMEIWGGLNMKIKDTTIWHVHETGMTTQASARPVYEGLLIVGDPKRLADGENTKGVSDHYSDILGASIHNYKTAIDSRTAHFSWNNSFLQYSDCVLACEKNIVMDAQLHYIRGGSTNVLKNITFKAPYSKEPQNIHRVHLVWAIVPATWPLLPIRVYLLDLDGRPGDNHQLYFRSQHKDFEVPGKDSEEKEYWVNKYGGIYTNIWDIAGIPEFHLTNMQALAKGYTPIMGEIAPTESALLGVTGAAAGFLQPGKPGAILDPSFGYAYYPGAYSAPLTKSMEEVYKHPDGGTVPVYLPVPIPGTPLMEYQPVPDPEPDPDPDPDPIPETPVAAILRATGELSVVLKIGSKEEVIKLKLTKGE